jgi:hypothetical protein
MIINPDDNLALIQVRRQEADTPGGSSGGMPKPLVIAPLIFPHPIRSKADGF